ncbi:MAG: hypothetical protein CMF49_01165 [Legionellales bacterium]|nr:hypothetical protein [Legionellales bacterium]|tara:strand:- start:33 stop:260 length:228 start_codon:yes stop_codon:yes gene_type:complete
MRQILAYLAAVAGIIGMTSVFFLKLAADITRIQVSQNVLDKTDILLTEAESQLANATLRELQNFVQNLTSSTEGL